MVDFLPDNALDILACPHCKAFPMEFQKDGSLFCSACSTMYPPKKGIFDLRPPGYDQSGEYQGDPPEEAHLRNQWDSTHLRKARGVQEAIEQTVRRTFPDCQVLDAGCGTGHLTRWIAERAASGTRLWATDVSKAMCQLAQKNCERSDQVTVIRAGSYSLPFQKCRFDVLFARLAPVDIEQAYELLRPGGWFIPNPNGF